ncbi:MAG: tyrosine-type recombinase/integrase [Steroidobacteraceae bacterium]
MLREHRDGRFIKRRLGLADTADIAADGATVLSWEDALRLAVADERPTVTLGPRYTVAQALEDYWVHRVAKSPTGSVEADRIKSKAVIEPAFGDRELGSLTAGELRRWRDGLVKPSADRDRQRRSQATANRVWSILRAVLNHAYANDRVVSADAWRRIKPFKNVDRAKTRTLTVKEAQALLKVLPEDFARLAMGSMRTGLRLGECIALRVKDVGKREVRVEHSKTGKARMVPLESEGRKFFASLVKGRPPDDLVFKRADGKPWGKMDASRYMARGVKLAKLKTPATFHDLRRSYGSWLINEGANGEVIQKLLGHADTRMTLRAYAHLLDKTVRKELERGLPKFGMPSAQGKR